MTGDVIGFGCYFSKIMQSEILVVERIFVVNTNWFHFHLIESDKSAIVLWKNNASLAKIVNFAIPEQTEVFALLRHMEDSLPFAGGFSPIHTFRNQKQSLQVDEKQLYFDSKLLIQYLNMNVFLQNKLASEIGSSKVVLVEKIWMMFNKFG